MKKILFKSLLIISLLSFTSCASLFIDSITSSDATGLAVSETIKSISKATEEITIENEYYIGRSTAAAILKKYPLYTGSPKTTLYLNHICSSIVLNSSSPEIFKGYYVAILDTSEITAMSTPGGHIFVSRGLLNCTTSEDALAAVIAHEIAHIELKHSVGVIKSSRWTDVGTKSVAAIGMLTSDAYDLGLNVSKEDLQSFYAATDNLVGTLVTSGYAKSQECEADKRALELMNNTGYDANSMIEMLEMIDKTGSASKGGWNETHPKPQDRIYEVKKQLKKMELSASDKSIRQARFEKNKL